MGLVRRFSFLVSATLLGVAIMLGALDSRPAVGAHAAAALAAASSYFDSTIVLARHAAPRGEAGDELAIALGYLQRLQIGLGSPFRLADEAARDPRLSDAMSTRAAWAVLARLDRGDAYVIDPEVLDGAGPWSAGGHGATGAAHLALIQHIIASASDPRAGELAVRLAYMLESAKGTLAWSTASVATQVAALVRDRANARADMRDLFADADAQRRDVLELLAERRASRGFRVEAPPLAPLPTSLQVEAMSAVPAILRALDTLDRQTSVPAFKVPAPVLGARFAARLASIAELRPPTAQVSITLRSYPAARIRATNEEALAAASVSSGVRSDSARRSATLALLSTAIATRSLAQSRAWFPGDGGPDASELASEFGVNGVRFTRAVPVAWRPYYLRELQTGLRDMQRVFPAFSVDGLRVALGVDALPDSALAMHDPRSRTLQLSIYSSGGTIAHELSHDLDWQAARRLFASGGGYSSDRAMAERTGALSLSLRGLAEARLLRPFGPVPPSGVGRPAELFACGTDWFVASSLAATGRSNGFLSAIEDGLLAGYAAGQPTAIGTAGARSLTSAIGEMTYVPDSVRRAFESQWSDTHIVDPALLVRRALETPVSWRGVWQRLPVAATGLPASPARLCASDDSPASRARENIVNLAVDARARGMALRRARYRSTGTRPDWANSVLGVTPWAPDEGARMVDALRATIAAELTTALPGQGVVSVVPAIFRSSIATCSAVAR